MSKASESTIQPFDAVEYALDGRRLTLEAIAVLLGKRIRVEVKGAVWRRIEEGHAAVQRLAAGKAAVYGVNTGFGHLCTTRIPVEQIAALQRNLIISHAVGVGPPMPADITRWMMLFKVHAMTHGVSGASRPTVELMLRLLEADALPVIPTQGSLGASGDLAPLAHMVLPMIGQGTLLYRGCVQPAGDVLRVLNLSPVTLAPKDGLALVNGTQFMAAYAAHVAVRARRLVKHADVIGTMSLEGCSGSIRPFDERLHRLRPHPGAMESAENVRRMMTESEILAAHADCDRVQDPYSLRCIPQVHGACRDALRHACEVIETELNSVTDNPLIFENDEVVSGGLFHGEPLALVLDYLALALCELASISERRTYLLLSGAGGLPLQLMNDIGVNTGLMVAQYTAAALVSENKGLATPACVDSIPTSLGQEDHVSMGARSAVKCLQVLENTETVLAIEQFCAAQALDFRAPLKPGVGPLTAHGVVRKDISHADRDRIFGQDIETSLRLLRSGRVLTATEERVGPLL
jgi:histidine ammonia-lyase